MVPYYFEQYGTNVHAEEVLQSPVPGSESTETEPATVVSLYRYIR
jgi:hypothetical protein